MVSAYDILASLVLILLANKVHAVSVLCQVRDAIRSHRVAGAECNLLSNAGIFLKTAKSLSNSYGVAVIEKVQPGNYRVSASRIGYYTLSEYLTIAPDSEESKMIPLDLVISPKLSLRGNVDMYRIVLTWGKVPRDLDSYILTPWPTSGKCKHGRVFYNERKCSHGSESIGLDVDATDMYGPETITLRGVESGSFSYYVHIYTNGVCWDKIRVKVYQASTGGLLYNINQPKCSESGSGFSKFNCSRYWNVLTFDASTAKFKIHAGRFTNTAPTLTDHGLANPNCNCTGRAFITGNDVIQAATRLSDEAVKLNMEKLCIKEMEEIYNNAAKKDIRLNPSKSVAKLATFVSNRIEEKRRLAIALKNLIKNEYEKHVRSSASSPSSSDTNLKEIAQKQCCTYDGDKASYSTAFNKWVDMKSSCWSWPQEIKEMPHELVSVYEWTAPLEKLMMNNFDTTSQKGELKWQYFTDDKTGFHRRFPAEVLGNAQCGTSDQRLKPWYIEGVRGPKNIIILVDISYAMKEENKFLFARTAIVQVLKGMLNNDFTNVIAFAEAALLPGMTHGGESDDTYNSCLKSQLVQANEQNQKGLERFVQDVMLASEKTVNYYNAISTALKLVTNTMANNNRDTHLIFVTGSQDTSTESIPQLLKNANTSISVHVYHLVGRSNNSYIRDSRAKLAEMAAVTKGKLETIYDYNDLAFRMGRFYKNIYNERIQSSDPYLSSPSFDERLGMYVTLGVPCYTDNKELIGVVGIDITLSELLKNTVAFGPGELSYTFVIETDTGRALVHPQLPLPGFIQNEPVVINIKYLEQSSGFSTVLASMMRRETGTKVLRSERVLSRGDPAFNGYRGIKSDFTYSWRPVNNTNFAVCVVVANDELDTKAMDIPNANPQPDLYHRYDIVKHLKVGSIIEDKPIAFLNNITFPATLSRSNYFLSSSCFNDPYRFENTPETLEFVKELSDFVDGKRSVPPMQALKKEVLADIRLTREIEQCWNRNPMRVLGADAAWRYIATNSGAMRQYPGRQTYNNRYDPTTRPWYHAAKSYPGKLTFSVPYLDNGGAGVVVTTSQTISSVSMVRAVMGIDWKMKKINEIVTGSGAICQHSSVACILIDPNGYVVYSKQFIFKPSITKKRVHLAYKHPELLRDLMKKGVISTSLACNDLELGQTYVNYKIADDIPSGKVEGTTRCGSYIMVPVPNTNVYLIALDGGDCPDTTVKCRSCSKTSCADGITKDLSTTIPICVPCVCSVRYNPCALHYYQSPNAAVVCPSIARNNINTKTACKKPDTDSTVLKGPKTIPKAASPPPTGNGEVKGAAPTQNKGKVETIFFFVYSYIFGSDIFVNESNQREKKVNDFKTIYIFHGWLTRSYGNREVPFLPVTMATSISSVNFYPTVFYFFCLIFTLSSLSSN